MEYYTAINKNKIMKFAGKRMDLEKIIVSEVTQTHKDTFRVVSLICGF